MAKSIKFLVTVPVGITGSTQLTPALFTTGNGPCGRVVDHLDYFVEENVAHIIQRTECGETKRFTYKMSDIHGRIEAVL